MTLTSRERARARISGAMGRLPVITMPRTPSSMAFLWMSVRSPTMMIDWPGGMFSFSENFQKVRTSMAPILT